MADMASRVRERGGRRIRPHELGARARGAAPPRGARRAHGRRGARGAPARPGQAHRARARRPAAGRRQLARDRRPGRRRHLRRPAASSRTSCPRTWSSGRAASTGAAPSSRPTTSPCAAGAADAAIWQKMVWAEQAAHELRVPLVRLVDGTGGGGSVKTLETMGFSYVPPLPGFELVAENLSRVPVVAAALGPCAGLGAVRVTMSHFSVIVKGTAQLFIAGPPVVAAAMGESPGQGGARRLADADARRSGRQRGRRRGRRARPAAPLPVLPARQRVGGAADRRLDRRSAAPRGRAAGDHPARRAQALRHAPARRARLRSRLAVRGRAPLRAAADHAGSPASTGAPSACSRPTPSTTAAA